MPNISRNVSQNSDKSEQLQHDLAQQVIDLQATVAHLELTIDSLDAIVSKQDKQLQDMQRQLQLLFVQLNSQNGTSGAPFNPDNEIPPHY